MRPFLANGEVWRVIGVDPGDPRLIDRTGTRTVATTDPITRTIHVSKELAPPKLDIVMLHEVAHAITMSYGLLGYMHEKVPERYWIPVEEWAAQLIGEYGLEAVILASESLGRPLCIDGHCLRPIEKGEGQWSNWRSSCLKCSTR